MAAIIIEGGRPLTGSAPVSGAKNSALPALVAAALADDEPVVLESVPQDADVATMIEILRAVGVTVVTEAPGRVRVLGASLTESRAPYAPVRRMRASFYVAGLLLSRMGHAEVPLPGGCALGSRPVDYHLKGFEALGARIDIQHGYMLAAAPAQGLQAAAIHFSRPSVGATIQLLLAAVRASGETLLENCAREPEVVDVANLLNAMGACIRGAGSETIRVEGVAHLHGTRYTIIPDRIEAATLLLAGAITGGRVVAAGAIPEHLVAPAIKLKEAGFRVETGPDAIQVETPAAGFRSRAVDLVTAPYPGFPTDLQQPFVALLSLANGTSVVQETIFDRFRYIDELRRMGADIRIERDTAIVRGVARLTGARVEATDLRGGAALALAALAADGRTRIEGADMIDRGYEAFEEKLRALGARIWREDNGSDEQGTSHPAAAGSLAGPRGGGS